MTSQETADNATTLVALFASMEQVSDTCYVVAKHPEDFGYQRIARKASLLSDAGQWMATTQGISWRLGSRTLYFVDESVIDDVKAAREIASVFIEGEIPWSVGACSRKLLSTIGPADTLVDDSAQELVGDTGEMPYGYHQCTPARREDAEYFDVSGCWYNLLCSLPGPRLIYSRHSHRMIVPIQDDGEMERWSKLLEAVSGHKLLRNALAGTCMGGINWRYYWTKGLKIDIKTPRGPFRAAGLMTARIAAELCWIAAQQTQALYAQTDCVITDKGKMPTAWGDYGLRTRLVDRGETEVCSRAIVRCGDKSTKYWQQGMRMTEYVPSCPQPTHWFYKDAMEWRG